MSASSNTNDRLKHAALLGPLVIELVETDPEHRDNPNTKIALARRGEQEQCRRKYPYRQICNDKARRLRPLTFAFEIYAEKNDNAADFNKVIGDGAPGWLKMKHTSVWWEHDQQQEDEMPAKIEIHMNYHTQLFVRRAGSRLILRLSCAEIRVGDNGYEAFNFKAYGIILWDDEDGNKAIGYLNSLKARALLVDQWAMMTTGKPEPVARETLENEEYDEVLDLWIYQSTSIELRKRKAEAMQARQQQSDPKHQRQFYDFNGQTKIYQYEYEAMRQMRKAPAETKTSAKAAYAKARYEEFKEKEAAEKRAKTAEVEEKRVEAAKTKEELLVSKPSEADEPAVSGLSEPDEEPSVSEPSKPEEEPPLMEPSKPDEEPPVGEPSKPAEELPVSEASEPDESQPKDQWTDTEAILRCY